MGQYIDFSYVKQHADFESVLDHYGIAYSQSGDEARCLCPFHEDTKPSLTINFEKRVFHCHAASCGAKGNVLEFVAAIEDSDLRSAAVILANICQIDLAPPKRGKRDVKSSAKGGKTSSQQTKKKPKRKAKKPEEPNPPLSFSLQLDPEHEYGASRALSPDVIRQLEMGFCSRGMMSGRWCAPVHNAAGEVVAYVGRYAAEPVPDKVEKYRLPKGFRKDLVLFNLHRVAGHANQVTVVEGIFDAARLHGLGMPAVALLGSSVSDEQVELLVSSGFEAVVVLMDAGSEKAERKLVHRLSRRLLVRSVALPDGEDPATVSVDFLREYVPVFEA